MDRSRPIPSINPFLLSSSTNQLKPNWRTGPPQCGSQATTPALGETRQIWFTRDGNLFQVIMYSQNIEWLDAWARELPHDWTFSSPETALAL